MCYNLFLNVTSLLHLLIETFHPSLAENNLEFSGVISYFFPLKNDSLSCDYHTLTHDAWIRQGCH